MMLDCSTARLHASPAAGSSDGARGCLYSGDVGLDLHSIGYQDAAGLKRLVPTQAELLAVDLATRLG